MIIYQDIDNDSGVSAYEFGEDYIDIRFEGSFKVYRYSYQSAGKENVERMKVLAQRGEGLHAFINKYVKDLYLR